MQLAKEGLEWRLEEEELQIVSEILEALQEEKIGPIDKVLDEEEKVPVKASEELGTDASFGEGFSESYASIGNYTAKTEATKGAEVYYNEFKKMQEDAYEGEPEKVAEEAFKQDTQERKIAAIFGTETKTITLPTGLKIDISCKDWTQRVSEDNWKVINQATGWAWILYDMQNL